MTLQVQPPIAPMLATLARCLPEGDFDYEPKWDGFRVIAFRDGDDVDLRSRNDSGLARYFPELVESLRQLPSERVVLDGEIVVLNGGQLDFAALMSRLHPAASRVERLRRETPAVMIVFDVLEAHDEDLRPAPFATRRSRLAQLFEALPLDRLLLTPSTRDHRLATQWLNDFNGRGVDGVVARPLNGVYAPGKRALVKVKKQRTLDCVVAGFRLNADETLVASLLLGLHDARGALVHIGVSSQFSVARRAELLLELTPFVMDLPGHPWEQGFGLTPSPLGRLAGAAGRWSPEEMSRDWIAVRPERVCEVSYETLDGERLRHPARFRHWRPDRDASSCGFDQIERGAFDVRELFAS